MDFYFDADYDMSLDGQDIAFTDDDNKVVQRITSRLQFILEEWFLDPSAGLPYPQVIFEAGTSIEDIYNLFYETIKNTDDVETVTDLVLTANADDRTLLVQATINQSTTLEITVP